MANQLKELFQSLVGENIPKESLNDSNVEFKLCYDFCSFKTNSKESVEALSSDMHRMVLYLYYTRLFVHTNSYFQRYLVEGNEKTDSEDDRAVLSREVILQFLISFLDLAFTLCKIAGFDPNYFDFKTVMEWDVELLKSFVGVGRVDVFGMTGFLNHSLIMLEDKVNWRLIRDDVNDWQGAREEVGVLFVVIAIMARILEISYKELCSYFILTASSK